MENWDNFINLIKQVYQLMSINGDLQWCLHVFRKSQVKEQSWKTSLLHVLECNVKQIYDIFILEKPAELKIYGDGNKLWRQSVWLDFPSEWARLV